MNHVFGSSLFSDRDPDQNMVQMNSLFMSLISTSSFCDCQSMPLKNLFGDFYHKARFSVENTIDKYLSAAPVELRPTRIFERFLDQRSYADTLRYRAEVPEGLKITYLEYLEVLVPAQIRANNIIANVVDPFTKFVGRMVSDEIFRNQVGHQVKEFLALEKDYDKIVKSFSDSFGVNDYTASATFGQVVKRSGDWKQVFSQTLNLKKFFQEFPGNELATKLNRLYETLDALIEQVKLDHYDTVEKEVTQLLSTGMYHVAKEVELAALTTFRSKTFIESVNKTITSIEAMAGGTSDHEYR